MIRILPPHRNLGCLGLVLNDRYVGDLSLPHREGWGWTWSRLLRIYFRGPDGRRHWLYLPGLYHRADRD
jgi:hypothetical protein